MRIIPSAIKTLLKSKSMIGVDKPRCVVTFTDKSTSYSGDNIWVQAASQYESETGIVDSVLLNGEIYACSSPNGKLLKFNGTDAWIQMAPQYGSETVLRLVVKDSKIYGGTYPHGYLLEFNGTNAWVRVALQYGSETTIYSLVLGDDNKIYAGTYPNGNLFQWNDVDAWVQKAPMYGAEWFITALIVKDGDIYAGTSPHAYLLKWNNVDTWEAKATWGLTVISSLVLSNDGDIYGECGGHLLRFDNIDTWEEKAAPYESETGGLSLIKLDDGNIYGGSSPHGNLLKYNGVDAWVQVAPQLIETVIYKLIISSDGRIYGCTGAHGNLLKWSNVYTVVTIQPAKVSVSKEETANAQSATVEIINVNPSDSTDAGYYSPYRGNDGSLTKPLNDWHYIIVPSKNLTIEAGYGTELSKIFTGTIDDVDGDVAAKESSIKLNCRDYGWMLLDKSVQAVVDGVTEYYIEYPVFAGMTVAWLTADTYVILPRGNKMIVTSDLGGPVTIEFTVAEYTGTTIAAEWENKLNANATLTGGGTITFTVSYNDNQFTVSCSGGHTIAITFAGSTVAYVLGFYQDLTACTTFSILNSAHAVECMVKDLCIRAGFAAADITIEPTFMTTDMTFDGGSYSDAIEQLCTVAGFEFKIDDDGKPFFVYPTDRQPAIADEAVVLNGTTPVALASFPVVTASIIVYSSSGESGTLYSSTTDYLITVGTPTTAWTIERRAGSAIGDGDTVYVSYVYAAWVFKEGEDIFRLGLKISRANIYGKIVVLGDDCTGTYITSSPIWDGSIVSPDKILFVNDINLWTDEDCQMTANRLGADMMARYIQCEFAAVAVPWLQVGDCVQVIESSTTISEIYRITSLNIDISPSGAIMTFKCYHYGYAPI